MNKIKIEGYIKIKSGEFYTKQERIDMELHDAIDYLVLKYVTKGGKLAALPTKFVTELSRSEQKIKEGE